MGQAAIELPDPLEATEPTRAASADDLLSQMAGDEIDRLLADNDVASEEAAVAEPVAEHPVPTAIPPAPVVEAKVEATTVAFETQEAVAAPVIPPATAEQPVSQAVVETAAVEPAPTQPVAKTPAVEKVATQAAPVVHAPVEVKPDPAKPPAPEATVAQVLDAALATRVRPSSSPVVRFLELLNAPANSLSEGARTALGKLAIITTVNAIAILAYVILFRR